MAQEFTINSSTIEAKINQLLPSQGGFGAGVDFSASTMVIPIVDLTESAEGSNVRQDLQTALSFKNANAFDVSDETATIIETTGYYNIIGNFNLTTATGANKECSIKINDGATTKKLLKTFTTSTGSVDCLVIPFNIVVFLEAGDFISMTASSSCFVSGSFRQIATITGELVNT
mgnify:FL=1